MTPDDTSDGLDTIRDAYRRSLPGGVTLLDTAEVYGNGVTAGRVTTAGDTQTRNQGGR